MTSPKLCEVCILRERSNDDLSFTMNGETIRMCEKCWGEFSALFQKHMKQYPPRGVNLNAWICPPAKEGALVAEGLVKLIDGDLFLETAPQEGDSMHGYLPENLLEEFVGKRVRVTVEIIE